MRKISMRRLVAATLAAQMVVLPVSAFAGGGGLTGGATLPEQIVQETTLVEQLAKQASMVTSQLQMVYNQLYNLQQLNPQAVENFLFGLNGPFNQYGGLQQVLNLINAVKDAQNAYQNFAQQLQNFQYGAQQMNMTPTQYLQLQAQAAVRRGGVYKQVYDQQAQAIQNLQTAAQNVQDEASQIPNIKTEISGLQHLMDQNTQMQAQLISINQVLRQTLQLEAMRQEQDAADTAAAASAPQNAQQQVSDEYGKYQQILQNIQNGYSSMTLPNPAAFNPAAK